MATSCSSRLRLCGTTAKLLSPLGRGPATCTKSTAGNDTYAKILSEHGWERTTGNPDLNPETKGGLVEWVLSFASIEPFYPGLSAGWGLREAKRISFENEEVPVAPRRAGAVSDDGEDEDATTTPAPCVEDAGAERGSCRGAQVETLCNNPWNEALQQATAGAHLDSARRPGLQGGTGSRRPCGSAAAAGRDPRATPMRNLASH